MTELERVTRERDVLTGALWALDAPPCLCLQYDSCPKDQECRGDNPNPDYCWQEYARQIVRKENEGACADCLGPAKHTLISGKCARCPKVFG